MKNNRIIKYLSKLEVIGNRLPHPVSIFIIFLVALMIISHIFYMLGVTVKFEGINPETHQLEMLEYDIVSLLIPSSISHIFTSVVENFTSFVALGPVLVVMLGVGVAEKTG